MNSSSDDLSFPLCHQPPIISMHEDELTAPCPATERAASMSSHPQAPNVETPALPVYPADNGGGQQKPEIYLCQFKRCKKKRERHGKPEGRFLFSAEWREMKIGVRTVWVVDLTARCPECNTKHAVTLIPPVISPALPRGTLLL
jgi:hypothetical protein